ncbi:alpha/beta hydrolase [Enterococcus canintestini]|uniref:Alpha/beta hydrolase n=1 Tax=Enterococcus canintestini TaxID=317010 RepID=A0A267HWV6_9ENTE|nr:alpha/beta hydrolase [Enterococcus canintestini]PAB02090.1 alpha/beta hydrolase [Enterococcus canintestini]
MKKVWISIGIIFVLLLGGLAFAGNYFYDYAFVPAEKDFLANDEAQASVDNKPTDKALTWFKGSTRTNWYLTSQDGLKLRGIYLPAENESHKTAIIAHGYMGDAESMYQFAGMYHELGYNVLVPDARGHGESQGDYIGFGWPERKDYVQWIDRVLTQNGEDETIVLHGVSMGAATVMMTSGEKLPANVKAIVEDCGYSSIKAELVYQYQQMFNLPTFPIIQVTNLVTRLRAGFFFTEGDVTKQLEKNKTPMLFIHGSDDTFVPFSMLDEVYAATSAPKEKWVVDGAEHAESYSKNPERYKEKVKSFLSLYE